MKAKFIYEAFEKRGKEFNKRALLFPEIKEIEWAADLLPGILRKKFTMSQIPPELINKLYGALPKDNYNLIFPRISTKYESISNAKLDGLELLEFGVPLMAEIFKKERWFNSKSFIFSLKGHNIQFVNTDGILYLDIEPILCYHYKEDNIDVAWRMFCAE